MFFALVAVLLASNLAFCVAQGVIYREENITQDGRTLLLGALFPLSRNDAEEPCGSIRGTAVQLVESMVLAIRTINEDPTLLPNITLTFDMRDTCTLITVALQQSVDYIQNINCVVDNQLAPSGVLGAALSDNSEATANLFGLFNIPQISYASTASALSDTSQFNFFFRTIPPDFFQASALADIVTMYNWNYIMALHSGDLYGTDGVDAFIRELEIRNSSCIAIRISLMDTQEDYREAVDRMSEEYVNNATVALLFGHTQNAVGIFGEIETRSSVPGFRLQNLTWIGSDSWGDSLPDRYRPLARGMLSVIPLSNPIQEFDDYFTSLNPRNNPQNPWFAEFWENLFECNLGMSPGLVDCDLDNQTINATSYTQFVQVPLVIDAVYTFAHSIQNLIDAECPNGDLCSKILVNGAINGELLREKILNVSFSIGSRGEVTFDANGDVEGFYSILNLQRRSEGQHDFEVVGSWNVQNGLSITEDIEFVEGDIVPQSECSLPCKPGEFSILITQCCFTCEPCSESMISLGDRCEGCLLGERPDANQTRCVPIPITFFTWSDPFAVVLVILSIIGIIATVFVIVVFAVYFDNELIKASSRELSAILLAGLLLCYIQTFFYLAEPSAPICAIRRFGVGFCFAVSFGALLVKTNRIHRIFNRESISLTKKPRFISPLSQVVITILLVLVQVVIAIIWLAVEWPGTRIVPSRDSRELQCGESPVTGLGIILAYNLCLLILSTYFAFRARKVPENFNEAKFINVTLYTIIIIWLALMPTYFATASIELGTVFQTASLILAIILTATTTLVTLYVSKVVILFARISKEKEESKNGSKMTNQFHQSTSVRKI